MSGTKARVTKLERLAAERRALIEEIMELMTQLLAQPIEDLPDGEERQVFELMAKPERTAEDYARFWAWLGLEDMPPKARRMRA